jgi:hypothetical protein
MTKLLIVTGLSVYRKAGVRVLVHVCMIYCDVILQLRLGRPLYICTPCTARRIAENQGSAPQKAQPSLRSRLQCAMNLVTFPQYIFVKTFPPIHPSHGPALVV